MSHDIPKRRTRGRSVVQYKITATGGIGPKVAEYPTITAASTATGVSYHIIRGILDGKPPKADQYYWKEADSTSITLSSPPPLPSHRPSSLSLTGFVTSSVTTSLTPNPQIGSRQGLNVVTRSHSADCRGGTPTHSSTVTPVITIHSSNSLSHGRSVSLGSAERPKKKDTIPSLMRTQVWNRWIGIDRGQVKCPYCQINPITPFFFECGHVLAEAEGGKVSVENLRPLCGECNRKMSTQPIDLNRYRLLPGIAGQINPQNKQPYPTTIDGQRAFIEEHTLTNLHGKVGEPLRRLKYDETETLAKTRWRNWVEVYEMCAPQPVLVTEKSMHLHPYNEQLAAKMKIDSCRSSLSKAFQKLGI